MDNLLIKNRDLKLDKSNWSRTKLGELAKDVSQRIDDPGQSEYDRFVGLRNFVSGDIKIKTWETTENLTSSAKAFQAGDILFARRNAYLRRASLVDFDGCCSGDAFVLRENHDRVVPGFLAFLLNSNALWDYANSNAAGTMSKRVKWRDLSDYEFLLPPKDQQKQLAKLFWTIDGVIETNVNSYKKFKLFEESRIIELLTENDFNLMGVDEFLLNKKGAMKMGPFGSSLRKEFFVKEGIKYKVYGQENVFQRNMNEGDRFINNEKFNKLKSCEIFPGDFLITVMGTIGKTMIVPNEFEKGIMDSHLIRLQIDQSIVSPLIIALQFKLSHLLNQIKRLVVGGIMDGLSSGTIKKLKFMIPAIDNQAEILTILKKLSITDVNFDNKIKSSKSLQKSLINQVF